jgi:hypothetical protein
MGQISESYASPGLRLGLLLEDHPQASYEFRLATGDDIGVPTEYGGGAKKFCVATIHFGSDRPSIEAWKPVADKGTPDDWNILCTKTLGRALKRAGYPDDLHDLKALVLWRQREAEIAAIKAGSLPLEVPRANTIAELPSADPMQAALDEAGVADAEEVGDDEATDAEVVVVADVDTLAEIDELVAGLSVKDRKVYTAFCDSIGYTFGDPTPEQAEQILGWFEQ